MNPLAGEPPENGDSDSGRTAKGAQLYIALVTLALVLVACVAVFLQAHRQYLTETRELVADQMSSVLPVVYPPDTGGLGPYYISYESEVAALRVRAPLAPGEEWSPPLAPLGEGYVLSPITLAEDALMAFTRSYRGQHSGLGPDWMGAVRWLLEHQDAQGSWVYAYPHVDLEAGWHSAMMQGMAVSVLSRQHQLTGDESCMRAALDAYRFMMTTVADGGCLGAFDDGRPVLEEYPGSRRAPHVLNGTVFALFGVYDLLAATGDAGVCADWARLTRSLEDHLRDYDTGVWSRYALSAEFGRAAPRYHRLHISQLRAMSVLTGRSEWEAMASRWEGYLHEQLAHTNLLSVFLRDLAYRFKVRFGAFDV
jgi:hypothetical protein